MIRIALRTLKRLFEIKKYNVHNGTMIKSVYADLNANYGQEVRIGEGTYIAKDVEIGDYSYVNRNSSLEHCSVGKYCSISSGVFINPYEHNNRMITTHPIVRNDKVDNIRAKVEIGNDVLISLNVIVLAGVSIGDGAVIGAGAVVTKDVEPYEIVGGVPAKHIKWRFEQNMRKELLELKWWEWPREKILSNIKYLRNETDKII